MATKKAEEPAKTGTTAPTVEAPKTVNKFATTTETRSSGIVPFSPTNAEPFTVCMLVSAEATKLKFKESDEEIDAFRLKWVARNGINTHVETLRVKGTKNEDTQREILKGQLKHIYECYAVYPTDLPNAKPEDAIGYDAIDYESMFKAWEEAFNKDGEGETPIFKDKLVWLKTVIDLGYVQGGLTIGTPNFTEPYKEGQKPLRLKINPAKEALEVEASKATASSPLGRKGGDKLPDTSAGSGEPDFSKFA